MFAVWFVPAEVVLWCGCGEGEVRTLNGRIVVMSGKWRSYVLLPLSSFRPGPSVVSWARAVCDKL